MGVRAAGAEAIGTGAGAIGLGAITAGIGVGDGAGVGSARAVGGIALSAVVTLGERMSAGGEMAAVDMQESTTVSPFDGFGDGWGEGASTHATDIFRIDVPKFNKLGIVKGRRTEEDYPFP